MRHVFVKLTSRYRVTIPKLVHEVLRLNTNDQIIYDILDDNTIRIRKASHLDVEYTSILDEWDSIEDEIAYNNL